MLLDHGKVCLSVCLPNHLSISFLSLLSVLPVSNPSQSTYLSTTWISLFIYLSIYLYLCLSIHLNIYISIYLYVYRSIYINIYISIYLCVYLSIFLPFSFSLIFSASYLNIKHLSIHRLVPVFLRYGTIYSLIL